MDLKKLKTNIENYTLSDALLVFENWDPFLSEQYVKAISDQKHLPCNYISSLDEILIDSTDLFGFATSSDTLDIFKCDDLLCTDKDILRKSNLIIITNKITDKDTRDLLDNAIVKAQKLERKYIEEYIAVRAPKLKQAQQQWLLDACNNNIFRIEQELDKLNLFPKSQHADIFDEFMLDGIFSDLATDTILTFIEAIMVKNKPALINILENMKNIDIEPLGVITLLYRNIKLILDIQFNSNVTAESLNIKPGYLYMLKKKCGYYSKEQLVKAFMLITKLEFKLKQGEIAESNIIDYILVHML